MGDEPRGVRRRRVSAQGAGPGREEARGNVTCRKMHCANDPCTEDLMQEAETRNMSGAFIYRVVYLRYIIVASVVMAFSVAPTIKALVKNPSQQLAHSPEFELFDFVERFALRVFALALFMDIIVKHFMTSEIDLIGA